MIYFGIVLSEEEISNKYDKIYIEFSSDNRNTIPRAELANAISKEFEIGIDIAEAYITIGMTYYSSDWSCILDNVIRLMKTDMCHSVYKTLKACGIKPTVENAKNEIKLCLKELKNI